MRWWKLQNFIASDTKLKFASNTSKLPAIFLFLTNFQRTFSFLFLGSLKFNKGKISREKSF